MSEGGFGSRVSSELWQEMIGHFGRQHTVQLMMIMGDDFSSHRYTMGTRDAPELLPGTLDLLILRTLVGGAMHGYAIVRHLKEVSNDVLQVGESSLYPGLQRLLLKEWVKAEWGTSENNRRARYYTLTSAGRKQLTIEREEFDQLILAIQKVLSLALGRSPVPEAYSQGGGQSLQRRRAWRSESW